MNYEIQGKLVASLDLEIIINENFRSISVAFLSKLCFLSSFKFVTILNIKIIKSYTVTNFATRGQILATL